MIVSLVMAAARLAAVLAPLERDQARDAARRELQREVYHRDDPSPLTRLLQTAGRVIGRIVDRAGQLAPGGTVGLLLLLALALALLAAIRLTAGPLARSPGRLDGGFRTGARTAE
ncbi:MAG: hypothetical protein M3Z02_05755, partial [Actinomycetota bacterium]|nr:hypothetical protein [Actinomycetota bacterium]